jgi:Zn-finger nucleic acid-binding protein
MSQQPPDSPQDETAHCLCVRQPFGLFLKLPMHCPLCEGKQLTEASIGGVPIEACTHCGGMWIGAGRLEKLPERPSVKVFLPLIQHAPGRCRRKGHPIPRAMVRCPTCGALPAECPECSAPLVMVPTPGCAIDICPRCEGVWLDRGEMESLRKTKAEPAPTKPVPAGALRGWEVPAPSPSAKDPWLGPGQVQAIVPSHRTVNVRAPLSCRLCDSSLSGEAWAFDGDIYCSACRPQGAVSGHQLPRDWEPADQQARYHSGNGWGYRLLHSTIGLVTGES